MKNTISFKPDQLLRLEYGKRMGLMYQIYMDPEFTAYRMDAFIDILQNGGDLEALALASDKRRSDTFCHNMCFAMSHGIPPMEYARMYDEQMEADWEPNR